MSRSEDDRENNTGFDGHGVGKGGREEIFNHGGESGNEVDL